MQFFSFHITSYRIYLLEATTLACLAKEKKTTMNVSKQLPFPLAHEATVAVPSRVLFERPRSFSLHVTNFAQYRNTASHPCRAGGCNCMSRAFGTGHSRQQKQEAHATRASRRGFHLGRNGGTGSKITARVRRDAQPLDRAPGKTNSIDKCKHYSSNGLST